MSIEAMKKAHQVPLVEQLESVPADARLVIDDADSMGTRFIPVGRICREAAAAIRTAIEQAEKQEPVAWMVYTLDGKSVCVTDNPQDFSDKNRVFPLYTDPPAIEAKLKEKNK